MVNRSTNFTVYILHGIAVLAIIAAITFLYFRVVPVNHTTVALTYLLAVLVIATRWGLLEAAAASVLAVLCFNFFFLPPVGTLAIADPQNWVALFAFLAASIIASQLSARARQQTLEAVGRQREMERLYALSRAILLTDSNQPVAGQIAQQISQIFGCPGVMLYDRYTGEVHRAGSQDLSSSEDKLRQAALQGTLIHDDSNQTAITAIRLGGQPIASLAMQGASVSRAALQAISNLVAIGLEKARGQEAANRAEAVRQSDELKSTLLDVIAHEFKTPLTSIKAAASALLSDNNSRLQNQRELVTIVDEEADRLGRLVTEAIQMARIEAGKIQLNRELHAAPSLISAVVRQMQSITDGRDVLVDIGQNLPMVLVDAGLVQLALRQLIDNAVKYSPPGSALFIHARQKQNAVVIGVKDQGPGIPPLERSRIFERFYRGPHLRQDVTGTGMGLAIARQIMLAHEGDIWVESEPGNGAEFFISAPIDPQEAAL